MNKIIELSFDVHNNGEITAKCSEDILSNNQIEFTNIGELSHEYGGIVAIKIGDLFFIGMEDFKIIECEQITRFLYNELISHDKNFSSQK